jgi:Tol biopolymer transport system component
VPDIWRATRTSTAADFGTPAVMTDVSSPSIEHAPSVTDDELVMAFASTRDGDYDIYLATRAAKAADFSTPFDATELNSPSIEDSPELSGDGLRIVFHSNLGPNGDLYAASRADRTSAFGNLAPITELNTGDIEDAPALSSDELELFFVSDRPGGRGLLDIWRATRPSRGEPFSVIENVTELNSAGDEHAPSLSGDGTQLYYSYNAMTDGSGEPSQVWVATRTCQ